MVGDDALCERCANEEAVICSRCGERIYRDDNAGDENTPLCQPCYDRHYTSCERCGRIIHLDDAYLVSTALSPCYYQYADTIRLVSYLHMAAYLAEQNYFHTQCVLEQLEATLNYDPIAAAYPTVDQERNLTFQEAVRFADLFSRAWENIYGEVVFETETKHFLNLEQTACRIYEDGHSGAAYFGRKEYFPYALEDVQKMIDIYEEIISHSDRFYEYAKLLNFAPELLLFVLMGVFRREAEMKIPQITNNIHLLFSSCAEQ